MIRAGLTGGLGCGKSYVGRLLEGFGCYVVRADELGHQVLLRSGEAYASVVDAFGPEVLDMEGNIDRKKLANLAFPSPERLKQLNDIVHPAVMRREEELLAAAERLDPSGIGIVEAAILIETGSYRRFDKLIVVVCRPEQQLERAMSRDGSSVEQVQARLVRQMPVEEKRRYADYIIDNSGAEESTVEQTAAVYESLRRLVR
jgi:dephospho-CoA kinase